MAGAPTFVGIAAFAAVKLAGYSAAGLWFRRAYAARQPHPLVFGLARTSLGIAMGIAFAGWMESLGVLRNMALYYALLLPVRLAEWLATLAVFYRRAQPLPGRRIKHAAIGSAWSYALDLPAVFAAFTVPGGMWIC